MSQISARRCLTLKIKMHIIKFKKNITVPQSVIALGFFDGVHLGHQKVIKKARDYARLFNIKSSVFTFKKRLNKGARAHELILKFEDKVSLIGNLGADYLIWTDFNKSFSSISAHDFVKKILVEKLKVRLVVVGYNYRFGKDAKGDVKYLVELSKKFGFKVDIVPAIKAGRTTISSTRIKKYLTSGNVFRARNLLGRNFFISGKVIKGKKLGGTFNIHTANLNWPKNIIELPKGVYAVNVKIEDKFYKGAANFGFSPTFNRRGLINQTPTVETHILNFNRNIYRREIQVFFVKKIREEKKFNSVEDLIRQIKKDIKKVSSGLRQK